jgi:hypothetical protein
MDEREWLTCTDPEPMLEFLHGRASERKVKLFGLACCRGIWHLVADEGVRRGVEAAERGMEERLTGQDERTLAEARRTFETYQWAEPALMHARCSLCIVLYAGRSDTPLYASNPRRTYAPLRNGELNSAAVAANAAHAAYWDAKSGKEIADAAVYAARDQQYASQAVLLRDLFGNPFRPVALDPTWLTPTVVSLAQAAYDHRTLPAGTLEDDRLAVLADALEEAGCTDADILGHLRGLGPHVRGCFAVDLVLNKT